VIATHHRVRSIWVGGSTSRCLGHGFEYRFRMSRTKSKPVHRDVMSPGFQRMAEVIRKRGRDLFDHNVKYLGRLMVRWTPTGVFEPMTPEREICDSYMAWYEDTWTCAMIWDDEGMRRELAPVKRRLLYV